MYPGIHEDSEHRATTQTGTAIVFQQTLHAIRKYVENRGGSREPLEGHVTEGLDLELAFFHGHHALRDQNLARLRVAAKARRQSADAAIRALSPAPLVAGGADRGVAVGNAYAKA